MRDRNSKGNIFISVVILALTLAALIIIVNISDAEAGDDSLVLKGMYGKTIAYSSITSAELYEADLLIGLGAEKNTSLLEQILARKAAQR